ncbi:hypothetical protein KRR26_28765 [Corallococcus sp. M34]|uniref:hypothetical protein n=1 Tax=Citreicoccus inhibens TaxID=2849499 RepID=UPI0011C3843A|nr:hypothetical protein [Citreicoccus inhibens]MBU8899609.1 hypothetical protein [Citreicoccus inhibens]
MKRGAWSPLLVLFGGTRERSFVDVTPDVVTFRFGFFEARIPRTDILDAARAQWPLLGGIGWRVGVGTVGLVGARQNIVAVSLREPQRVSVLGIPVRARLIFVSLEEPEAFIADLQSAT